MKKKLNIENIANELEGASLFFRKPSTQVAKTSKADEKHPVQVLTSPTTPQEVIPPPPEKNESITNTPVSAPNPTENNDDMHANMQASNNASMHASKHSSNQESIIETIRKAVRYVGKDSVTYRFTPEEKKALLELSFSYKMQGYKTSENELIRIAINFLLEDQKQNGRTSILQRVLEALNK